MAASAIPTPVKRKGLNRRQRRTLAFYLFISPWLLGFVLSGCHSVDPGV